MANHNGTAYIAAAVRSVLRQTERALELIVSDDCSSDDSVARARQAAGDDPRLIIITSAKQTGPAAARNRALAAARGKWIAIVDSDDYIHPERLDKLIRYAAADGADIVADNLLTFYEGRELPPHLHLSGAPAPRWISAADYVRSNFKNGGRASFGYLKPLFRRLDANGAPARYDETLTIAEDFDLILRLQLAGARMRLYPDPLYFYRKHAHSISHRQSAASLEAILAANDKIAQANQSDAELQSAMRKQRAGLEATLAFSKLISVLKARDIGAAAKIAIARPAALLQLSQPISARLSPRRAPPARAIDTKPRIALISRQRIVGVTNGSSAYILAIADALKSAGYAVDFIGASPKIFGRWAGMRLRSDLAVFDRYLIHGGVRVGNLMLAKNPRALFASGLAVLDRILGKLGLSPGWSTYADYAQAAPATTADMLYVARHVAPNTRAVLCDYAFLAPMAPYALCPDAETLIIMHDLLTARVTEKTEGIPPEILNLKPAEEFHLLGLCDAVIAIQAEEAARVREEVPHVTTLVAPHGVPAAPAAQPGADDTLLFVGSGTMANVIGLTRFFEQSWPLIRAKRPNAELLVAGSASRALKSAPPGVRLLGVVRDLTPLYGDCGVVISPLYTGSGLKIKLIEALAAGKAVVGTSVTAQGVEDVVAGAMIIADDTAVFAAAVVALLTDQPRRAALGAEALACANANFSSAAAFRGLITHLRNADLSPRRIHFAPQSA